MTQLSAAAFDVKNFFMEILELLVFVFFFFVWISEVVWNFECRVVNKNKK